MSDIVQVMTPAQHERFREYFDLAARPFFNEIASIKLMAGRKFTITPTGDLKDEVYLFTPAETEALEQLRKMVELCRNLAMTYALDLPYPAPKEPS